uniref:Probable purine permease n=1 Tax=Wollemia nobilis TaxID=56998 RepID=A0A0C9RTT3_9CONI
MEVSMEEKKKKKRSLMHWLLLLLNCFALSIGSTAGPLLLKFYFHHGGKRRWLSAWLQTAGFPILIPPLWVAYRRRPDPECHVTWKLCIASLVLGLLTGFDDFLYAWGIDNLPVSTSSLLISSQLAFNAVFAFLIVRQKFGPYSINAVVLLSLGSAMLAFHTSGDRPTGVTSTQYAVGFILTIVAAALYGLILPLIELMYKRTTRKITYTLVMEMQVIMSFAATAFCTVGMAVNKDFQAIGREAKAFDVGEVGYYMGLVWNAICFQLFFIGVFGVIALSNSLLSGIFIAVLIPVTEVLGVVLYQEKFSGEKGMALALSLWGFVSYLYGEHRSMKKAKEKTLSESAEAGLDEAL